MSDPISWLLIERGLRVVDRDGAELGRVEDVLGDEDKDIFNGLAIKSSRFGAALYLPAERVVSITTDAVEVDLGPGGLDALDEHGPQAI